MGDFQDRAQFANRERYQSYGNGRRDYMGALTGAVQQHPVAAALIGMGVLWLFSGGNKVSIGGGDGRDSLFGYAADGAGRTGHALKSAAGSVAGSVSSSMSSAAHAVSDTVNSVTGAVTDAVSGAAGAVSDTVSDVASRAGETMTGGFGRQESHREYRNDIDGWRNSASQHLPSLTLMRQNVADVFNRYPLALAAAGLALGAGAAAGLPLTGTEKSVLGKAGEAAVDRAKEMGQQAVDVASAALDEAGTRVGGNPAASSSSF